MDGRIDWAAIPVIVDLYGIEDVEMFIDKLSAIREHVRLIKEQASGK